MTMAIKLINPCAILLFAIHTIAKINEASANGAPRIQPNIGIRVIARARAVHM